jgi:L-asparaginase II
MPPLRVRSVRGAFEETSHQVVAAVVTPDGRVVARQGDAAQPVLLRSAAKPFQAAPLLQGAAEHFGISAAELALTCASHNSEKYQVDLVRAFLHRIGLSESDLVCGPHRSLIKDLGYHTSNGGAGEPVELVAPSPVASNCSGKHTGMLALARYHNWPTDGYWREDHPVQRACRASLAKYCDVPAEDVGAAMDGCGVVCWSVPLRALGRAYAVLVSGQDEVGNALAAAMMGHPDLVAGKRRLCTALMTAGPGKIVAKIGAGGVYAAGLPEAGLGVVLKVLDGNSIAAGVALVRILRELGLFAPDDDGLRDYVEPAIVNTLHDVVGRYEATGSLQRHD